jgi:hypothetical protein
MSCHVCGDIVRPVELLAGHPPAILHSFNVEGLGERIEFCSNACANGWATDPKAPRTRIVRFHPS